MSKSTYDLRSRRPEKDTARNLACEYRGKTHKVALFLTVPGIPDIRLALKNGLVGASTTIIVVNYDRGLCLKIEKNLREAGFRKFHVIDGSLENSVKYIESLGLRIDYAFLDFCGCINNGVHSMLFKMRGLFADNARIAITLCSKIRSRSFIDNYQSSFNRVLPNEIMGIFSTPLAHTWVSGLVNGYFEANSARIHLPGHNIRRMARSNITSNFVWQVAAVWSALCNRELKFVDTHIYHENKQGATSMGFVQFWAKKIKDDPARFGKVEVKTLKTKKVEDWRRAAALKAWETRRARGH